MSRSLESPENRRVTQDLVRLHAQASKSPKASKSSKAPPMNIYEMENLLLQVLPPQHSLRQNLEQQRSSSGESPRASPTFREPIRAGRFTRPSTYVEMKEIVKQPVSSLPTFSSAVPPLAVKPGTRRRQVMSPKLVEEMLVRIERAKQMMTKFGSRKKRGKKSRKRIARK
jgi:hypothetical protein